MKLQLIFLLLILSLEVFSLGHYLKVLIRLVVLLNNFLMILMMVQSIQALVGRQPNLFFLLFLVVLMFVTTVETSLYLYFQALCQVYPLIARKFKSCDMLSRKQILSLDENISLKLPDHLVDLNFFESVVHTIDF